MKVEGSWLTPFKELIIMKPVVTVPFSFLIHTTLVLTIWRRSWMGDGAGGRSLLIAKAEVSSWKTSSTTFFYPKGPTWCERLRGNQAWWSWRQYSFVLNVWIGWHGLARKPVGRSLLSWTLHLISVILCNHFSHVDVLRFHYNCMREDIE